MPLIANWAQHKLRTATAAMRQLFHRDRAFYVFEAPKGATGPSDGDF